MCWTLFFLLSNFHLSLGAFADTTSTHVHVAANDECVVFARNRDAMFHITLSPYATPTVILYLRYAWVETEAVTNLIIPTQISRNGLIELVFIGERSSSSETTLFHAKLQTDVKNEKVSVVHLKQISLAPLSSVGVECALGVHPRDTHVFVVGDRAGYIYDMNELLVYNWSSWKDYQGKVYPRVIGVSIDEYVIVRVYVQLIDTIVPTLFNAKFRSNDAIDPLEAFSQRGKIEITNVRGPMSMTLRGAVDGGGFTKAVDLPTVDSVLLYFSNEDPTMVLTMHQSAHKGINFGQAVTLAPDNTYGVLSSAMPTPPWSTDRVHVCCLLCFHGHESSMIDNCCFVSVLSSSNR